MTSTRSEGTSADGSGRARVVLLAGPSGSGKTRLAHRLHRRHGWPVVRLDDFYRGHDDPELPRHPTLGIADWDDPASWDAELATAALAELAATGTTRTPVYDISTSQAVGSTRIDCGDDDLILAEGIFAAELVAPLRAAALLHSAFCVRHRPWVTFGLRLARDLRERRKAPWVLVRRGWALMRAEPRIVGALVGLGTLPARAGEVEQILTTAAPSRHNPRR